MLDPSDPTVAPAPVKHVLRNGTAVVIRLVRPDDRDRFRDAFSKLDPKSIYTRFFGHKKELSEAELDQATKTDLDQVVALVATIGSGADETIIAGARYVTDMASGSRWAEIAFTVEEDYQGLGIAKLLLGHLIQVGRAQGLSQFTADVLSVNRRMLGVFLRSGLPMRQQQCADVIHVWLTLN